MHMHVFMLLLGIFLYFVILSMGTLTIPAILTLLGTQILIVMNITAMFYLYGERK